MSSALAPEADYVLQTGLDRALGMIREGRTDDAERALTVAADAANIVDVAARIVGERNRR